MCIRNCPVVVCTAALSSLRVEGMASGSIYTIEKLETDPRKEYGPHIFNVANYAYFVFLRWLRTRVFWGLRNGRLWPQSRNKTGVRISFLILRQLALLLQGVSCKLEPTFCLIRHPLLFV